MTSLYKAPSRFRIVLDANGQGRGALSVYLNDQQLVNSERIDFATCAAPFAKIGIYRPGARSGTSRISFDDVRISSE